MELFGYNIRRLLVIVSAIIIISLTATDLANDHYSDTGSKVIKYIVLFVAVAGFVGVMQNNVKYLQWYLLLLAAMTVVKIGYIVFAAFKEGEAATGWDIAVAVFLATCTVQTADIVRAPDAAGYQVIGEPLLG